MKKMLINDGLAGWKGNARELQGFRSETLLLPAHVLEVPAEIQRCECRKRHPHTEPSLKLSLGPFVQDSHQRRSAYWDLPS